MARGAGPGIAEGGAPVDTVIVMAEVTAGLGVQAMDHAGFEIGDIKTVVPWIMGDVAERRTGIGAPVQPDIGEFLRQIAIVLADPVDCSGPGVRSPHAGHPAARLAVQPESRRC